MQEFKVSIYPTTDKKFFTSFCHPISKKRIRQRFNSRDEANAHKAEMEAKFGRRRVENYRELKLEDLLAIFIREHPKSDFARACSRLIDFSETFGHFYIYDLTTDAVRAWFDQVQQENDLKEISMRGIKSQIDPFFADLVRKDIISESPLKPIYYKKPVPSLTARNLLTPEQIQALLAAMKAYSPGYLYPMIRMFAETAAKTMEVIELTWHDVDLDAGLVHFREKMKSRERKLKISAELVSALQMKTPKTGKVFMTYYKEPFTKEKLTRAINEFKAKKTLDMNWTPMDLRHSFAVNYLAESNDMRELQRILGHDNVFDTKRLYGEAVAKRIVQTTVTPLEVF